jgi:chromosome segregation ATPase
MQGLTISSAGTGVIAMRNGPFLVFGSPAIEQPEIDEVVEVLRSCWLGTGPRVERFENEMKWVEQRLNGLLFNRENLTKEEEQAAQKIESHRSELSINETENEGISAEIASLTQMWADLRPRLESVDKDLTEKRILLASVDEKRISDSKSLARLKADIENIASDIDLRIIDTENCEKEILELTARIAADEEEVRISYAGYSEVEADLARERELKTGKESRIAELETQARGVRGSLDGILKQMNDIQMEIHKITLKIDALRKDIQDKYFVDLATMIVDFTSRPLMPIASAPTSFALSTKSCSGALIPMLWTS